MLDPILVKDQLDETKAQLGVRAAKLQEEFASLKRFGAERLAIIPELEMPIPDATNETKTIAQLRIFARSLENFITIPEIIIKIVGRRIANPAYPIMKVEGLSNIKENSITDVENAGAAHIMKLSLFLKNGNEK